MLKVSRSLKETAWKVRKAEADWQNTVGREPTLEELSEKTGIRKEEIVQSLAANTEVDSLYRSIPGNQGKEITLGEQICDRHNEIEERTDHLFLEQLLDTLEAKEQQLIYLRYVEEKRSPRWQKSWVLRRYRFPEGRKNCLRNCAREHNILLQYAVDDKKYSIKVLA